jgi:hypothetical protein
MPDDETYLGDGVYASFDGWQICLRAPREDDDHVVFINPSIWSSLTVFAAECWPTARKQ